MHIRDIIYSDGTSNLSPTTLPIYNTTFLALLGSSFRDTVPTNKAHMYVYTHLADPERTQRFELRIKSAGGLLVLIQPFRKRVHPSRGISAHMKCFGYCIQPCLSSSVHIECFRMRKIVRLRSPGSHTAVPNAHAML